MDAVLEAQDRTVSRRRGALPFVGRVIAATPGESVLVERILHLDEDLYLADHAFVHAPGVKPLSACLPVLPMMMSIEVMAEVAACVVPGQGLIGVEEIKATRWIDLVDVEATILTIEARLDRYDPQREATFVRAAIRAEGQSGPSVEATLLFGRHYLLELFPDFGALDAGTALRVDAASLYAERHLFHGPAFRCLFGEVFVEDRRIAGHLRIPSPAGLFRSTAELQLLLQPCVLDAICQMVGVYAMQRDRYAFPVGLGKLELYRPTPPAGTLVPVRIELRKTDGKTIHADVEAEDGEGGVWMRIADLRCWKFQWERRLVDYRRAPGQFLLGRPAPVGDTADGPLVLHLAEPDLGKFDPRMLARDCLGLEEAAVYESHARFPARQRQWLLGRAVAKDCARRWISNRTGAEMAHPAAILVRSDPAGRPYVAGADGREALPHVSIAHCEDRAIAAAHSGRVGVDIERIADRDDGFLAAVAGPDEREKVKALGAARRAEWITRLWGAKEAVGKLLGSGVDGRLKSLEAVDFSPDGSVRIQDRETMFAYAVETIESDGFIIACATEDAPLPPEARNAPRLEYFPRAPQCPLGAAGGEVERVDVSGDTLFALKSRAESVSAAASKGARMTLLIAWRNLVHDRIRFAITLTGIAFSTILMGIQLGMLLNFVHTISTVVDHAGADLWITAEGVPSVDLATPLQERRRFQAMSVEGVAAAEPYMLHFGFLKRPDGVRQIVIVIGIDPDATMGLPFAMVEGPSAKEALAEPDGAVIDRLYADKLGIRTLGETVEINSHRIRVVGFTDGIRTFTQAPYVFMSLAKARSFFYAPDNDIAYVLVRVAEGHKPEAVAEALAARMSEVEVLTAGQLAWRSQYYWLVTTGAGITLVSSTLLALLVGVVIVAQTLYASTMDRLPEYAVIRAMGGPRSYLYRIIVQQAVLGGVFGAAIGLAVIAVVVVFTRHLSSAPEVPLWLAFGIVVATMLMCVAASIGSIGKVMTVDPVKVFR